MFHVMARHVAASALLLCAAGCALPRTGPERLGLQLPPAALGQALSLRQTLTVERDGRVDQLEVALEVEAAELRLVGMALGKRVLTLRYDGHALTSWRHPMVPPQLRAEDILEDIQLTLWPVDTIRQALPAGWRIDQAGAERVLSRGDTPVCVIRYDAEPRWSGKIGLSNLRHGYRLTIHSVLIPS
jgi:hypothetical protein